MRGSIQFRNEGEAQRGWIEGGAYTYTEDEQREELREEEQRKELREEEQREELREDRQREGHTEDEQIEELREEEQRKKDLRSAENN